MIAPVIPVRYTTREGIAVDTPGRQAAVFFDRDGVINDINARIRQPEQLERHLIPGALDALARLSRESDVRIFLASNQGAAGHEGHDTEGVLRRLGELVEEAGGRFDAIYYSPNNKRYVPPEGTINGRKPEPGMLLQAAHDFREDVDLADSYFVGDMSTDIAAAEAADQRVTSVLVETGFAGRDGGAQAVPDHVCADITAAVDWIIARERSF